MHMKLMRAETIMTGTRLAPLQALPTGLRLDRRLPDGVSYALRTTPSRLRQANQRRLGTCL